MSHRACIRIRAKTRGGGIAPLLRLRCLAFGVDLVSFILWDVHESTTPKNVKMIHGRFQTCPCFVRSHAINGLCWTSISYIGRCSKCLGPKVVGVSSLMTLNWSFPQVFDLVFPPHHFVRVSLALSVHDVVLKLG